MAKIIESMAFSILVVFGFLGAMVAGIVFHEYSHAQDFSSVAENEELCGLVLPTSMDDFISGEGGYYMFSAKRSAENVEKIEEIKQYTEVKAYSVTFLVLLLFLSGLVILSKKFLFAVKGEYPYQFEDNNNKSIEIEISKDAQKNIFSVEEYLKQ